MAIQTNECHTAGVLTRFWLIIAALIAFSPPLFAQSPHPSSAPAGDFSEYVPGADALEGRIRAPCCWNQTLDIHGSEVSQDLRREIRRRLKAGETQAAIEADLVDRYGNRILAVPPESPLKKVAVMLSFGMIAAGGFAVWIMGRWRRRGQKGDDGRDSEDEETGRDRFDDEIDAELERL